MRIVIDTNILVSAAITPHSATASVVEKCLSEYVVFVSKQTKNELVEVFSRPKFNRYFNKVQPQAYLTRFLELAVEIEPSEVITDCKDPKDNPFLSVAVSAKAHYLVTGDKKDLLSMNPFRGVEIITARDFLDRENTRKL